MVHHSVNRCPWSRNSYFPFSKEMFQNNRRNLVVVFISASLIIYICNALTKSDRKNYLKIPHSGKAAFSDSFGLFRKIGKPDWLNLFSSAFCPSRTSFDRSHHILSTTLIFGPTMGILKFSDSMYRGSNVIVHQIQNFSFLLYIKLHLKMPGNEQLQISSPPTLMSHNPWR